MAHQNGNIWPMPSESFTAPVPPQGMVRFSFNGGPRDGQSVTASTPFDASAIGEAVFFWATTNGGETGRVFASYSPAFHEAFQVADKYTEVDGSQTVLNLAPGQSHLYKVVSRGLDPTGITLQCEYMGIGNSDSTLFAMQPDPAP